MSKFKVGDKVRRIGMFNRSISGYFDGDPFAILAIASHNSVLDPNGDRHSFEYLELVPEGPVRTVTRCEIVPGEYAHVVVWKHNEAGIMIELPENNYNANELRSAAMVLSQIAEVLDDKETTK
jgi:hypothetical protein